MARYRIVPERSHVYIDRRPNVLEDPEFGSDGEVDLSNKPVGKLSLAVTKLSSGNRMEDRELHKRIDSRRFPTIEGVLDQMEPAGKEAYQVTGEITFRGVTKTHQDQMTIHVADEQTRRMAWWR